MNKNIIYIGGGVLVGVGVLIIIAKIKQEPFKDLSVFDSPDTPGSGKKMNKGFLKKLRKLEKTVGITFKYNSAYRTKAHNKAVGGVKDSAHIYGRAVDIQAPSKKIRDRIIWAAKKLGFKRIGIGASMVHLDDDPGKPQYVAWGYPIGTNPPYNPFA